MDKAIKECVEALQDVRRNLHNDTDPSIGRALDAVIARFESQLDKANVDETDAALTAAEALMIISAILSCCASMVDLMERF
jgi:predicted component of type VI protein secretion system